MRPRSPHIDVRANRKKNHVKRTTTSGKNTLVTGIGGVPMTRSQIAAWRRRVDGPKTSSHRAKN